MSRRAATSPIRIWICSSCVCQPYLKIVLSTIPAQPHHHPPHPHGRPVFRPVPLARFRRKIRIPVFRPLPTAPLPGRPVPFHCAPRLHLRRNGHVPAPVPVGGRPRGVCPRSRPRGGVSAHRWPLPRGRHRAFPRPAQRDDAVRGGRGASTSVWKRWRDVLKLRDDLARDVDRLNGVAITRSLAPFAVEMWFMARRATAAAAALWFRSARRQANLARPQPARDVRPGHPQKAGAPRAPGVFGPTGALGTTQAGATANGWPFDAYDDIPYRKLVNAVSRVTHRDSGT